MSAMIVSLLLCSVSFLRNPRSFSFWPRCFSSQPHVLHFLPMSRSPSPSGPCSSASRYPPPTRLHPPTHTSLHQYQPALKKGCCHWEIARKCPGGLHQLLSYRDVKCFKLLTQTADPDSRATQPQRCCETLRGSCYLSAPSTYSTYLHLSAGANDTEYTQSRKRAPDNTPALHAAHVSNLADCSLMLSTIF